MRFIKSNCMRLAQLARKLSVTPAEIVRYLQANGQAIADVNTRLEEEQLRPIISHFAPGRVEEILEEDRKPAEPELQEIVQDEPEAEVSIEEELTLVQTSDPLPENEPLQPALQKDFSEEIVQSAEEAKDPLEGVDVIKAPKVTLTGLKVLGKIDLPEPKKKEPEVKPTDEIASETDIHTPPPPVTNNKDNKRNDRKNNRFSDKRERVERPRRNPVTLQREREQREAEERRREELKKEKERRTEYYNNRIKQSTPKRAARLIDEPLEGLHEIADEPKTIWGKIWRWLTT